MNPIAIPASFLRERERARRMLGTRFDAAMAPLKSEIETRAVRTRRSLLECAVDAAHGHRTRRIECMLILSAAAELLEPKP